MGSTQVQAIYLGSTLVWGGGCECEGEPGEFEVLCCDASGGSSSYTYSGGVIPASEFYSNADIVAVKIGSGITHIGEDDYSYVFADSSNITAITLGPDVEYIGGRAFEGMTGVSSITIPASVTGIGTNAFYAFDSATFIFEGPCPTFSMEEDGDLGTGNPQLVVPDEYLCDYCCTFHNLTTWTGGEYLIESDEGNECDCECQSCGEQGLCDDGEGNCIPCEECACGDDGEGNCIPCE